MYSCFTFIREDRKPEQMLFLFNLATKISKTISAY